MIKPTRTPGFEYAEFTNVVFGAAVLAVSFAALVLIGTSFVCSIFSFIWSTLKRPFVKVHL